jgi:Zn-dependent oligopeptidase
MKPEKIEKLVAEHEGFRILTEKELGASGMIKDEATREKLTLESGKLGLETQVALVQQLIKKRHESAKILGYSSFSEMAIEQRMAKTPLAV